MSRMSAKLILAGRAGAYDWRADCQAGLADRNKDLTLLLPYGPSRGEILFRIIPGVGQIFHVRVVIFAAHTRPNCRGCTHSGICVRRTGIWVRVYRGGRCGVRVDRPAMMSPMSPGRSGRSGESEDSKTNKDAFVHAQLL